MSQKYTYKSETDKAGNVSRYKCWKEGFTDESSGEVVTITRATLIKFNGEPTEWYPMSKLKAMTPSQRKKIELKYKNPQQK